MTSTSGGRRKTSGISVAVIAATLVLFAARFPAAHHGQAGLFDESKVVELKGIVKKWSLVNPHPILLLEVTDESGMKVDYDVYFGPSAVVHLRRQGYAPETFRPGEALTVKGHPSKETGVHGIDVGLRGVGVTRGDGKPVP